MVFLDGTHAGRASLRSSDCPFCLSGCYYERGTSCGGEYAAGGGRLWGADVQQISGFDLHEMLSERQGMISLRDLARLVGADVRQAMAGFVNVSSEGRYSVRWMASDFVDRHWRPFFAAAWRPGLFF